MTGNPISFTESKDNENISLTQSFMTASHGMWADLGLRAEA